MSVRPPHRLGLDDVTKNTSARQGEEADWRRVFPYFVIGTRLLRDLPAPFCDRCHPTI
jgi:hypothetical protein